MGNKNKTSSTNSNKKEEIFKILLLGSGESGKVNYS
jgi:hypothetical protein